MLHTEGLIRNLRGIEIPFGLQRVERGSAMSETSNFNTPYDDAFRTMLDDCTRWILPVVNEVFHETYSGKEVIGLYPNEQYHLEDSGGTKRRVTDSHFSVSAGAGEEPKRYHIECQSVSDSTILLRMFEYDSKIAQGNGILEKNRLTVTYPHSALLMLRSGPNTPKEMEVVIKTMGTDASYRIPVIRINMYSLDEIFEKRLYFFLPFHIFIYEKELKEIESDEERLEKLVARYQEIADRLEALCEQGELSAYEKRIIYTMTETVVNALARGCRKIQEGVGTIMGGQVLEYEAKKIWRDGKNAGFKNGIDEGFSRMLVRSCCRMLRKGGTIDQILFALDAEEATIRRIVQVAGKYAPDYDAEAVFTAYLDAERTGRNR